MLARNVACGQPSKPGQDLPDLVRVAVDGLLAEHHQVRLLLGHHRGQHARRRQRVERGVVAADQDRAVGAHRQHAAQLLPDVLGADAHRDHLARALAALALLGQPQGGLDGVFIERVELPARGREVELAAGDLQFVLRVGYPLARDEDFHDQLPPWSRAAPLTNGPSIANSPSFVAKRVPGFDAQAPCQAVGTPGAEP